MGTEARTLFEVIDNPRGIAHCDSLLASIAGLRDEHDDAERLFGEARERADAAGDVFLLTQIERERAAWALQRGDLSVAHSAINRAEALADESGMTDLAPGIRALASRIALRRESPAVALATAEAALADVTDGTELAYLPYLAAAEVHSEGGGLEAASSFVEKAHSLVTEQLASVDRKIASRAWRAVPDYRRITELMELTRPNTIEVLLASDGPGDAIPVTWTLRHESDDEVADVVQRRRHRLARLLHEAQLQGARPKTRDLAEALGASRATVTRDLTALRRRGPASDEKCARDCCGNLRSADRCF